MMKMQWRGGEVLFRIISSSSFGQVWYKQLGEAGRARAGA